MFEELKKSFVLEVKDLLQNTEKNLLLLEKDRTNSDYLQEIFRSMHTIKGSAGIYGLDRTVKLAHSFESVFAKIKEGKLTASIEIISLSLDAIDIIMELIQADSEDKIPIRKTDFIHSAIDKLSIPDKNAVKKNKSIAKPKTKKFTSHYILFEPNADILERGISIETILSDFDEFQNKIITELTDEARKKDNKLAKFYEIIVSSEFSTNEIKAIFLFTPQEVVVTEIGAFDVFDDPNFRDFYENAVKILPFSEQRCELIINYCKSISDIADNKENETQENEIIETSKEIDSLTQIGLEELQPYIEETKQKQLQYIKVPAKKLDELLNLVSELIISNSQLSESASNKDFSKILQLSENIDKTINLIKENTLDLRLVAIKTVIPPYLRAIRDLSLKLNKKINFVEQGIETLVDKTIIDKLSIPLLHIIRNAIDHGIESPEERTSKGKSETGIIRFIAYYSNTNVVIQIQDDGRGIVPEQIQSIAVKKGIIKATDKLTKKEIYDLLFVHGFTTAKNLTEISGRGVGMDVIKKAILDLRGDIEIDSEVELGTSITIKLPLTLSIIETLHVSSGGMHFLIPLANIVLCSKIRHSEIKDYSGKRIIIDDELLPYIDIRELFNIGGEKEDEENLIIIKHGKRKIGLIFSGIHGEYQAVIKNLGTIFNNLDFLIGASILGNGSVAYILDSYKLLKRVK